MSHSVTVTRTTTTSTTTAILLNSGFFKTIPGLLKLAQTILGAVAVGLVANYSPRSSYSYLYQTEFIYFLLIAVTFLIGTAINLLSCLLSITTATILPKTMLELLYHSFAFILYVAAAIALIVRLDKYSGYQSHELLMAAAVIGLVNSALYLISAVYSYRSYRGG